MFGAAFVERGTAYTMFPAQGRPRGAGFGLPHDGRDLAIGVAGFLHVESPCHPL